MGPFMTPQCVINMNGEYGIIYQLIKPRIRQDRRMATKTSPLLRLSELKFTLRQNGMMNQKLLPICRCKSKQQLLH